jgi:hypothetical protein
MTAGHRCTLQRQSVRNSRFRTLSDALYSTSVENTLWRDEQMLCLLLLIVCSGGADTNRLPLHCTPLPAAFFCALSCDVQALRLLTDAVSSIIIKHLQRRH